jgi:hypothetical protein
MRTIDSDIIAQLQAGELRPFLLLSVEIDGTTYYYTDCDVPISFDSHEYTPRKFTPESVRYSNNEIVSSVTFTIDDIDMDLKALFVGGTPQGGAVKYSLIVLDENYQLYPPLDYLITTAGDYLTTTAGDYLVADDGESAILFEGLIDDWEADETELRLTVKSIAIQWSRKNVAKQSASCRWKVFKGTECAYSGAETWCDRTYARCNALGNTANFGGERWLPSIVGKSIWWGRVQGEDG